VRHAGDFMNLAGSVEVVEPGIAVRVHPALVVGQTGRLPILGQSVTIICSRSGSRTSAPYFSISVVLRY
jgi:hypothetical protein